MDDKFSPNEKLYRAVRPLDMLIREDGTLTSAAFKSTNGCSVDRGNGRDDKEAAEYLLSKLSGRAYSITVKDCLVKNVHTEYEPMDDDIYHSGLYKNDKHESMSRGQCKYLAGQAKYIKI